MIGIFTFEHLAASAAELDRPLELAGDAGPKKGAPEILQTVSAKSEQTASATDL
ncbi:hypothetical protein [Trinickia dinghuensis]|uniref:hypothetical protein n=1 Tax=Trinickia dinghuensis TaxID=2291023 RepID=UPI0015F1A3D4|nr:hypothetical protein [Trinickia dinghuensis]